ncbi:MAG: bifunctional hydroxymethylpyrimidine kinase/phosphomethylpyrimidine kinase [Acidimicrobiia bacterium]|nr:bifunctional hydroxymethylpyrimidine kinase/phosphomethylpyrimidine kinase [Acidimicrobiia bacterium]
MTPPVVLSIAGSDSGAGAGVQADLKTCAALGAFATTAITALTAQNTLGVLGVLPTPADFLVAQVRAVLADFTVAATKTGMLATAENAVAVAELGEEGVLGPLVVDPVLVDSSGRQILAPAVLDIYRRRLLALATVVTPNTQEAALLLGGQVGDIADVAGQRAAARRLGGATRGHVVVKGGRLSGGQALDVHWDGHALHELVSPWVVTANNHGTGCSFATAVAAGLAQGLGPADAIGRAKAFVARAVASAASWRLGAGRGGIDHFAPDP